MIIGIFGDVNLISIEYCWQLIGVGETSGCLVLDFRERRHLADVVEERALASAGDRERGL